MSIYQAVEKKDAVHQGRMMLLAIAVAFFALWVFQFVTYPFLLFPGLFYDDSGNAFLTFVFLLAQYGAFGLFALLLWAGAGWARYVLGFLLLIVGMGNLVYSVTQGSAGAVQLLIAVIELVSAAALVVSVDIGRYAQNRRLRGIPWLSVGLFFVGLFLVWLAVMVSGEIRLILRAKTDRLGTAYTAAVLRLFAPTLDAGIIEKAADAKLQGQLVQGDFEAGCAQMKQDLGSFRGLVVPPPRRLSSLALDTSPHEFSITAKAFYEKGLVLMSVGVDTSVTPFRVAEFYYEEFPQARVSQWEK
jgi:hypothetical protein